MPSDYGTTVAQLPWLRRRKWIAVLLGTSSADWKDGNHLGQDPGCMVDALETPSEISLACWRSCLTHVISLYREGWSRCQHRESCGTSSDRSLQKWQCGTISVGIDGGTSWHEMQLEQFTAIPECRLHHFVNKWHSTEFLSHRRLRMFPHHTLLFWFRCVMQYPRFIASNNATEEIVTLLGISLQMIQRSNRLVAFHHIIQLLRNPSTWNLPVP